MTWTDRDGQPLDLDAVFAAQLGQVKQRLGLLDSRAGQRRRRQRANDETRELRVRTAAGTHLYAEQDPT